MQTQGLNLPLGSTSQQRLADLQKAKQIVTESDRDYAAETYATKRPQSAQQQQESTS